MKTPTLATTLSTLGFPKPHPVVGRASVADLFPPSKSRCGIYVLHLSHGWCYVGKAVNVVRRYTEHCKTHDDIEQISFKAVPHSELNRLERKVIERVEKIGIPLRNIALVIMPPEESDFDLIMSPADQERWLINGEDEASPRGRVENADLRSKYHDRYQQFCSLPFADDVIAILQQYAQVGIPAVQAGEIAFWACSCLPYLSRSGSGVYARINVNWQEVLSVYAKGERPPIFTWQVARSALEGVFGSHLHLLSRHYPFVRMSKHRYKPGGQDQIRLEVQGHDKARRMLQDPVVVRAIREFNLRLCRKGPCVYGRFHCLDLAGRLLEY